MQGKKALIVATNTTKFPNDDMATGFWFTQVSHFYDQLVKNGWEVDIGSPKGGYCPIEPKSLAGNWMSELDWQYLADPVFQKKFTNSIKASDVKPEEYKVIYFAGGHGTVYDFYESGDIHALAAKIYENGGIVSAVCHGPVALINIKLSNGEYLIKDKKLTAFSNEEEDIVELSKVVPYSLEDELVKRGCKYERAGNWEDRAVADGRLITGQNPGSCRSAAKLVVAYTW